MEKLQYKYQMLSKCLKFTFADIVEIPEESDTDSEFDERMEAVMNEIPVIDDKMQAETAEKVLASNR